MIIPISDFAPDMPDVPSTSSDKIYNVLPATNQSYGPFASHQPFSDALSARCQGALSAVDNSGNVRVFAGDAAKLYRLTSASATPADVSKVGGYTTSSTGGWYFTQFGTRVIATNYNDAPQSYVEGTSTLFADLIATGLTTLKAKYAVAVKEFIVFGNTTDGTYGTCPQRVHWGAINDPTDLPIPGTQDAINKLSDYQDNLGPHGELKGIAGNLNSADAALFYERAVYRMIWSGQPDIFNFVPAEGSRGLLIDGALTQSGPIAYYRGEDGFYAHDGAVSRAIGKNRVDKFFYNDVLPSYLDRTTSGVDPRTGNILWAYPGSGSANGVPNRLLIYNPFIDKWTATEENAQNISCLLRGATFPRTLESLDSIGSLDSLSFSLDSPAFAGGRSLLAAFDSDNKFGYFDGPNLAAKVDTSDVELIPGKTAQIDRVRPLADSSGVTVSAAGRQRIQDTPVFSSSSSLETNGTASIRVRGRYHRIRQEIPAGSTWNHISGVNVENVQDMGVR